ncbi:V-type proton ATPase 16 kDa proteolipid subunit [Spatholobus suberectus]|nr:V-type proton ATPase 16 kDa proteolipid subunit [Spatholobus suberectus]
MAMRISPLVLPVAWLASLPAWLLVSYDAVFIEKFIQTRLIATAHQPKLFVGMIRILIFAEALALYGLVVGIILSSRAG